MRLPPILIAAALCALCAACVSSKSRESGDSGALSRDAAGPAPTTASSDPDVSAGGSGVPAGYTGRTDRPSQSLNDAKYTVSGSRWEVRTGPAHVVYAARDTARGSYTLHATFEQLEAPAHPEAFGVIFGGQALDQPSQRYTYFLVRGTGEYLLKVRDGGNTRDVISWRASDAVPKADASGKATYRLTVAVRGDSVRLSVNDRAVATLPRANLPTDGIVGLRINHNLHVATRPVEIER